MHSDRETPCPHFESEFLVQILRTRAELVVRFLKKSIVCLESKLTVLLPVLSLSMTSAWSWREGLWSRKAKGKSLLCVYVLLPALALCAERLSKVGEGQCARAHFVLMCSSLHLDAVFFCQWNSGFSTPDKRVPDNSSSKLFQLKIWQIISECPNWFLPLNLAGIGFYRDFWAKDCFLQSGHIHWLSFGWTTPWSSHQKRN